LLLVGLVIGGSNTSPSAGQSKFDVLGWFTFSSHLFYCLKRTMPRWIQILARSVLSLAILLGGVTAFLLMTPPVMKPRREEAGKPVQVKTEPAIRHTQGISIEVDGVVVPFRQIELAAEVSGKVEFQSESCQVGRTVHEGELLLRIEPSDYELEVRRLKEEVSQADAMTKELEAEIQSSVNQISNAEKQLLIEKRQLARSNDLLLRGAASASEVDSARKSELAIRTSLQTLVDEKNVLAQRRIRMEAAKLLVQANLEKAELSLERTNIKAPFDAVVVQHNVEEDSYVQPGNTICLLQETTSLDVACKLQMEEMNWLWQGVERIGERRAHDFPETPATVIFELAGNRFIWDAIVDRYDGAGVDSQTRMISCRVHVPEPAKVRTVPLDEHLPRFRETTIGENQHDVGSAVLKPEVSLDAGIGIPTLMTGMFVKVHIHTDPPVELLRIPQEAIQPEEKVWIVEANLLVQKPVTVAYSNDDYSVVLKESGGVSAGDLIIVSPLAQPSVGMRVEPIVNGGAAREAESPGKRPPTAAEPAEGRTGQVRRGS
jgi:multidrug efflux pump subunit AcrA (membrane-fusion protein)